MTGRQQYSLITDNMRPCLTLWDKIWHLTHSASLCPSLIFRTLSLFSQHLSGFAYVCVCLSVHARVLLLQNGIMCYSRPLGFLNGHMLSRQRCCQDVMKPLLNGPGLSDYSVLSVLQSSTGYSYQDFRSPPHEHWKEFTWSEEHKPQDGVQYWPIPSQSTHTHTDQDAS